jgi:hypothetical protein
VRQKVSNMHEAQRKRLDRLEEASGFRQKATTEVIRLLPFLEGAEEEEAVRAEGPHGFVCHRNPGESFYDFDARASWAALAARPPLCNLPPPILVFMPELAGNSSMKSTP